MQSKTLLEHARKRVRPAATTAVVALSLGLVGAVGVLAPQEASALATSVFSADQPSVKAYADSGAVTVGLKLTTRKAGSITGIRFYKGTGNDGTHVAGLYDATGKLLTQRTFTSETTGGWQTATLASPVAVPAGQSYTAAVLMPRGHYALDQRYTWPKASTDVSAVAGTYHYGTSLARPTQTYLASNYWVDVVMQSSTTVASPAPTTSAPAPTTTSSPAPAPTTTSSPAPTSTAGCVGASGTPGGADPWGGCWPGPQNTGYPHGLKGDRRAPVTLTSYTGPTTIRSCGVVIDKKIVSGDLLIQAGNGSKSKSTPCVTIKNSLVKGVIFSEEGRFGPTVVTDTEVFPQGLSYWENIGRTNMFVTRVNSHGSEGVIKCEQNCEAVDSWVHGMRLGGSYHYNAFGGNGMSSGEFLIRHNWASCGDWASGDGGTNDDAGCSAAIGFYGDFDPIRNITIERNYLIGSSSTGNAVSSDSYRQAGYCLNPGYYPGKPYPRPTNVKVVDNVFGRGSSGKCGVYGPTNSLNAEGDLAGNVWQGNRYADGQTIGRPEE